MLYCWLWCVAVALETLHDNGLFIAHGVPKNEKEDKEQYIVLREAVSTTRACVQINIRI